MESLSSPIVVLLLVVFLLEFQPIDSIFHSVQVEDLQAQMVLHQQMEVVVEVAAEELQLPQEAMTSEAVEGAVVVLTMRSEPFQTLLLVEAVAVVVELHEVLCQEYHNLELVAMVEMELLLEYWLVVEEVDELEPIHEIPL